MVRLFSTVLRRGPDGGYWLVTPAERGRIEVEDAPFTAVALETRGAGREQALVFRTNVDDEFVAGPDHPIRVVEGGRRGEPRPYVLVRAGLEALILRPVFYQLVDLAVERNEPGRTVLGVWSGGAFFALGARGEEW